MLEGGASRGLQSAVLKLSLDGQPLPVDDAGLPDSVATVAGVYLHGERDRHDALLHRRDPALRDRDAVIAADQQGRRSTP